MIDGEIVDKLKLLLSTLEAMVSIDELERRWKTVRESMTEQGLDWIICEGTFRKLGGYPRWFTDRIPVYNTTIAFPIEGDLYYISHGGGHHKPVDSPGVKHLVKPYIQTLYGNTGADLIVDILKGSRPSKVGLAGYGTLSAATYLTITKSLPEMKFVDASALIDSIKAVKSEEEIRYINHTVEIHEAAWELATLNVKQGRTPTDVLKKVTQFMVESGSTEWIAQAGAFPQDAPPGLGNPDQAMKNGDVFTMMTEFNGPEGYFNEVRRCICIGKAQNKLVQAFEDSKQVQHGMAKLLVPNADPNEILKHENKLLKEKGYSPEARLAGHSQGYDLVERPAFSPLGETIRLKAGMVVSLHPYALGHEAWGQINDNFLVTESGGIRITKVPQEIFETE